MSQKELPTMPWHEIVHVHRYGSYTCMYMYIQLLVTLHVEWKSSRNSEKNQEYSTTNKTGENSRIFQGLLKKLKAMSWTSLEIQGLSHKTKTSKQKVLTTSPNICRFSILFPVNNFWRHEMWGSYSA